ncbi:MAG: hypothetical protein L6265_08305 [Thermoplasmatales archaeon]|nr:hypothetical protein [Thermoplasmatales archaeon]
MKLLNYAFNYKKIISIDRVTKEEKIDFYPIVPCRFEWAGNSQAVEGLLDSGSIGIVIPMGLAKILNLELTEYKIPMKVVGRIVDRYIAKANLILGRGGRFVSIPDVDVSIPKEGETPVILGRKPIFELYTITFIEAEKRFIMEPYKKQ